MTGPFLGEAEPLPGLDQVGVGADEGAVGGVDRVPAGGDRGVARRRPAGRARRSTTGSRPGGPRTVRTRRGGRGPGRARRRGRGAGGRPGAQRRAAGADDGGGSAVAWPSGRGDARRPGRPRTRPARTGVRPRGMPRAGGAPDTTPRQRLDDRRGERRPTPRRRRRASAPAARSTRARSNGSVSSDRRAHPGRAAARRRSEQHQGGERRRPRRPDDQAAPPAAAVPEKHREKPFVCFCLPQSTAVIAVWQGVRSAAVDDSVVGPRGRGRVAGWTGTSSCSRSSTTSSSRPRRSTTPTAASELADRSRVGVRRGHPGQPADGLGRRATWSSTCSASGRSAGVLQRVGPDWCLVHGPAQDWVVRLAAVQGVEGASDRSVPRSPGHR